MNLGWMCHPTRSKFSFNRIQFGLFKSRNRLSCNRVLFWIHWSRVQRDCDWLSGWLYWTGIGNNFVGNKFKCSWLLWYFYRLQCIGSISIYCNWISSKFRNIHRLHCFECRTNCYSTVCKQSTCDESIAKYNIRCRCPNSCCNHSWYHKWT